MSRGSKYTKQVVEMDFQYPSEGIHYHWDQGEHIVLPAVAMDMQSCACLPVQTSEAVSPCMSRPLQGVTCFSREAVRRAGMGGCLGHTNGAG